MGQRDQMASQYPASKTDPADHANTANRRFGPEEPHTLPRFNHARYALTNGTNKHWEYNSLVAANHTRRNNGTLKQATRTIVAQTRFFGHPGRSSDTGCCSAADVASNEGTVLILESKLEPVLIAAVSEDGLRRPVLAVLVRCRRRAVFEKYAG